MLSLLRLLIFRALGFNAFETLICKFRISKWNCGSVAICIPRNLVHINIWKKYGNKLFFCKAGNKSSSHYLNMFSIGQANEDWWSLMHAKGNQNQISALAPMFNKSSSHLILIKYVNKFQITCQGINHAEMFWHILKRVATDKESFTSVPNFAWLMTIMENKSEEIVKFLTLTNSKLSWISMLIFTTSKMIIQSKVQILKSFECVDLCQPKFLNMAKKATTVDNTWIKKGGNLGQHNLRILPAFFTPGPAVVTFQQFCLTFNHRLIKQTFSPRDKCSCHWRVSRQG